MTDVFVKGDAGMMRGGKNNQVRSGHNRMPSETKVKAPLTTDRGF